MVAAVVQLVLQADLGRPFLDRAEAREVGRVVRQEAIAQGRGFEAGRGGYGAGRRRGVGVSGLEDDGGRVQRLHLQVGTAVAVFFDRQLANIH